MKLKIVPMTLTAALTAVFLFGGWFVYRHYGVERPLDRIAADVPGVKSASSELRGGEVVVTVELKPDADLATVYNQIRKNGDRAIGSKKLELNASADVSEQLNDAWSYSLFDIAEAMETHRYSGVREAMDKLSARFPGVTAKTSIDDDNVYISIRDKEAAKFVVLPREGARQAVWPNA